MEGVSPDGWRAMQLESVPRAGAAQASGVHPARAGPALARAGSAYEWMRMGL
jgi:hypothetical protein